MMREGDLTTKQANMLARIIWAQYVADADYDPKYGDSPLHHALLMFIPESPTERYRRGYDLIDWTKR